MNQVFKCFSADVRDELIGVGPQIFTVTDGKFRKWKCFEVTTELEKMHFDIVGYPIATLECDRSILASRLSRERHH